MQHSPSTEMYWLLLTLILTATMWVPYILNRMKEQGILSALWDPLGETEARAPWANRMMRAHENAVENLVIFAPLVLALQWQQISTETTAAACTVYFFARLAHFLVFTFGVPVLRVVTFLIGFGAQMTLALSLFN